MLELAFMQVLDMTKAAGFVIVCVLIARLLLKRAPKIFSYALWAVVLFRLLCPVALEVPVSIVPELPPSMETYPLAKEPISFEGTIEATQNAVGDALNGGLGLQVVRTTEPDGRGGTEIVYALWSEVWYLWGQYLWPVGIAAMAVYSAVSYILLRRRLVGAVPLRDNIRLADGIASPFVLGLLRPRIYLPSALPEGERGYIILHERHHIRRGDHIIKALAFVALCVHWFNPLVWAAFVLSSKDMEMSCDEAVVKKLGEGIRADYSASLLSLATGRRVIAGTPLAFGEGDTGSRIKNMLSWKKPKVWVMIAAAVICVAVTAACAGDPAAMPPRPEVPANDVGEPADPQGGPSKEQGEAAGTDGVSPLRAASDHLEDLAYHLELAAGTEFRGMALARETGIMVEYEDLLDDYAIMARESTDGKAAYIVGRFIGEPAQSPLHGMYAVEVLPGEGKAFQFLYREEQSEAVERMLAEDRGELPSSSGYRIGDSRILWSSDGGTVLIQPREAELLLDVPFSRYLYSPNGRAYIADAVSRGIDVCGKTDTFLYVYRISEQFGEISERIALTEAEAQAILTEQRVSITDGFGFSASLHIDGQTIYYNEREGIPQTVLDLAVEKCDYRFGDPGYITDTIREARLDCDWLDAARYADEADLPRLREILKNAEHGYVGACGYGARLTLTFTGGESLTVFKGTDGCDTIVFGSYGGYFLGEAENREFWEIFGLDPESKLPRNSPPAAGEG